MNFTMWMARRLSIKAELKHGKRHRDGDLPAIARGTFVPLGFLRKPSSGRKEWYTGGENGKRHRDGVMPEVEDADGTKEWYQNGELHRDGDLPAIEYPNGNKEWYRNGQCYRSERIKRRGFKEWWENDILGFFFPITLGGRRP